MIRRACLIIAGQCGRERHEGMLKYDQSFARPPSTSLLVTLDDGYMLFCEAILALRWSILALRCAYLHRGRTAVRYLKEALLVECGCEIGGRKERPYWARKPRLLAAPLPVLSNSDPCWRKLLVELAEPIKSRPMHHLFSSQALEYPVGRAGIERNNRELQESGYTMRTGWRPRMSVPPLSPCPVRNARRSVRLGPCRARSTQS